MLVITDSKKYAEKYFIIPHSWQRVNWTILNQNLEKLPHCLFDTQEIFVAEVESDSIWKYCFVAKHSKESQYKILIDTAREANDLPSGILCLAGSGDNFKGHRNRNWISMPGNLHLSAYLKPNQAVDHFHVGFTILSAISVVQTLDKIPGLKTKAAIKWVNDIFFGDGKVSGVITQTQTKGENVSDLFIGIGLNVETVPKLEFDFVTRKATSIKKHMNDKTKVHEAAVLNNLMRALSNNYSILLDGDYKHILDFYKDRSNVIGKNIVVYSDPVKGKTEKIKEGKVIAIGENLELFLEGEDEPITWGRIFLSEFL
jgi:biotin-[acetyl-CoA-carboxylase] ligase BirA-like protein